MTTPSHGAFISFVIPLFNEADGLLTFHESLVDQLTKNDITHYEIIYCNDGSTDQTAAIIGELHAKNEAIRLLSLSRNFGKENALSAGIAAARGEAIITLDGDGQHPLELIPTFIQAWHDGAQVVIGVRTHNKGAGMVKRGGSRLFYKLFNLATGNQLEPGSTDYRLIDKTVRRAFLELPETDRMTRTLIDWLGFRRVLIPFKANPRLHGSERYSLSKLANLAANSFISSTPVPLYVFGYLGVFITLASTLSGLIIGIEQFIIGDPLGWRITGTALLAMLLLFLVGIVLMSQGIISLYISRIQSQSRRRPLYVIDYSHSLGVTERRHDT